MNKLVSLYDLQIVFKSNPFVTYLWLSHCSVPLCFPPNGFDSTLVKSLWVGIQHNDLSLLGSFGHEVQGLGKSHWVCVLPIFEVGPVEILEMFHISIRNVSYSARVVYVRTIY